MSTRPTPTPDPTSHEPAECGDVGASTEGDPPVRTVHKYVLSDAENHVSTYERARIIHVANQREQVCVWAEVNTLERECMRTLYLVGTGTPVPPNVTHVGSAVVAGGVFVFHVYDGGDR